MSNICYKYSVVFSTEDWVLDVIVPSPDHPDTVWEDVIINEANTMMSRYGFQPVLEYDHVAISYLGSELVVPETI